MEQYNENEIIDDVEDELDLSQDIQDHQLDNMEGTVPSATEQQNIYNWFWKVVKLKEPLKSSKVGYLNNAEIGAVNMSVRDALNIAHLGKVFKHFTFANYFEQSALITSSTSMSRNGWFMDLSISQKKVRERSRTSGNSSSGNNEKWKLFKKKNTKAEE